MKNILFILCFFITMSAHCQLDNLFKYSTFYGALGVNNALFSQGQYIMEDNQLIDLTRENPYDFGLNIGIRKIARFKYQNKKNNFYDGSEVYPTDNTLIGAVKGLEYKFQLETKRQQGREFRNKHYFLRYLSDYYVIKAEHLENGLADVKFYNIDTRFRVKIGNKLNLTFGGLNTWRPTGYEYNAMECFSVCQEKQWYQLAFDYGYDDHYWYFDGEGNGQDDWYDYYNWYWTNPEGDVIADTDQEFYKYHYGNIVRQYEIDIQDSLGLMHEFSLAVGLSLYHYSDDFWIHGWADAFPKRWIDDIDEHTLEHIELDNERLDYNIGVIIGTRFGKNKNFGLFVEGNYNQMWERNWFNIKTGINYLFF